MMANKRRHGDSCQAHAVAADADARRLALALGLIASFMLVEVVAGVLVHSLALLSDAAHMLADAGALALSLLALRLAARPARGALTYGFKRAEILSAQFNGVTLLVLGLLIVYGAVSRLVEPPQVGGLTVMLVAIAGVGVNLATTWVLAKANRRSLNVEGSYQHMLTDLIAFALTAVAGAVILVSGFSRADPIASLIIAAIMLRAAYGLLRDSGRIFLEAAPAGLDPDLVGRQMARAAGVIEVHDLHVWEVTSGFPALSAHVLVAQGEDCHEVRRGLDVLLAERFAIDHVTLQVEHEHSELLEIELGPRMPASR